jgi:hypothetical protein
MPFGKTDSPHGNKTRLMKLAAARNLWPGCRDATRDKRGGPLRADGSCVLQAVPELPGLTAVGLCVLSLRQLRPSVWRFVEVAEASVSRLHATNRDSTCSCCFFEDQLNSLKFPGSCFQSMRVSICVTSAKIDGPIRVHSIAFGVDNLVACLYDSPVQPGLRSPVRDRPRTRRGGVNVFNFLSASQSHLWCRKDP